MKKRGFTLAEVMIAMALIGVIASLTIPTFVSSTRNKANVSKLSTIVSAVENSLTSMIASEAVQDLSETQFGKEQSETNFGKYFKLVGSRTSMTKYYGSEKPFLTLNKKQIEMGDLKVTRIFETKNGALLIYYSDPVTRSNYESLGGSVDSSLGILVVDVNSFAKPNVWGRDAFFFRIGNDGVLYPAGSLNFSILQDGNSSNLWYSNNSKYICTTKSKNIGCTARLIEKNYEIDY